MWLMLLLWFNTFAIASRCRLTDTVSSTPRRLSPILPNSKFCGVNHASDYVNRSVDMARAYDDVDRCCLLHDYCGHQWGDCRITSEVYLLDCRCTVELKQCLQSTSGWRSTFLQTVLNLGFCFHNVQRDANGVQWGDVVPTVRS
jgi:hypothetical protein